MHAICKKVYYKSEMKHLFQPNNKTHPIKTRFEEIYEVDHANTGRLHNSPVIYMQNLLNGV
jgi:hypothetical protein